VATRNGPVIVGFSLVNVFSLVAVFLLLLGFVLKLMHGPTLMDEAETINLHELLPVPYDLAYRGPDFRY